MDCTFKEYLDDIKSKLTCNNSDDIDYITYDYSEEEIDKYTNFFRQMWSMGISGYKALLFLYDHIEEQNGK